MWARVASRLLSSLRLRFLLLVLVAVIPGFGIILYAAQAQRRTLEEEAQESARAMARLVAEQQQRSLDSARGLIVGLSRLPGILERDPAACEKAVTPLLRRLPNYANVGAVAPDGVMFCSAAPRSGPVDLSDRPFVRGALRTGGFSVGGYQVSRVLGFPTLAFGYPATDGGPSPKAVVFASLDLAALQREMELLPLPPGAVAVVADRWGVVLSARPQPQRWVGRNYDERIMRKRPPGAVEELEGPDGVKRLFASHEVVLPDGEPVLQVLAGIPSDAAYGPVNRIFGRTLAAFGVLSLLALLGAVLVAELAIGRKLRALVAASRRIAGGDYRARTGIAADAGEIGQLVRAFDEMGHSLEALQGQNQLLLDSVGEGILGLDRAGQITFVNPAASRALGYDPEEMRGRRAHALIHAKRLDGSPIAADACPILAALGDGQVHQGDDLFWRKDGSSLPVEFVSTPIRGEGDIVGAVVAFKDVADRQRLESQLRHAQKMEAVGQLAGGIAHDFNNLLTAVVSAARFLQDDLGPGHPSAGDVQEILGAADRAAALTRQLLAFSRRQPMEPRVIDLGAAVQGMDKILRRLVGESIALECSVAPGARVKVDPNHVEQVLLNLVVNARDATGSGGRISIRVAHVAAEDPEVRLDPGMPPGPLVALTVSDTGSGMGQETLGRIFEPFFTTKPVGKGTGLGLSTVYGIVTQSGGAIRVRSAPGKGSTFRVYLPRCDEPVQAGVPGIGGEVRGGSETVLVVEDDGAVRALARRTLQRRGYRVLEADRPSGAIEVAGWEAGPIHLLLSDVVLPEESGVRLASRLRGSRPGMRVLFMSGYAGGHLAGEDVPPESRAFLAKPFAPEELLSKVREVLDAL